MATLQYYNSDRSITTDNNIRLILVQFNACLSSKLVVFERAFHIFPYSDVSSNALTFTLLAFRCDRGAGFRLSGIVVDIGSVRSQMILFVVVE